MNGAERHRGEGRAMSGPASLFPRGSQNLAHYDPAIGMKRLAVAEAGEKHFRRAKDVTRLIEAVELKL